MSSVIIKLFLLMCLGLQQIMAGALPQESHSYLDIETPTYFTDNGNSPLKQPDSLKSQPYFDFLSMLYRRDTQKSSLFQPYYQQNSRSIQAPRDNSRSKRAVVFRPLFVYRQQQVHRQQQQRRRY